MKTLNPDKLAELDIDTLLETLEAAEHNQKYNKLDFFEPYPKQMEFFALGATTQERMFFAGTQMGKSYAGAMETAYHLTGLYPDWWPGRRWSRPVKGWAAGLSTEANRGIGQTLLCGEPVEDEFGSGSIPKDCFVQRPTAMRGAGSGTYDTLHVMHRTDGREDGVSTLQFKAYAQGRDKFQGRTLDFVWWDEEPPMEVYTEGNARWTATAGMSFMTFTPLLGVSDVVARFLRPDPQETPEMAARRGWLRMGFKDALHMTEEDVQAALAKYPRHEWDARMYGLPLLGEGAVFEFNEQLVTFKAGMEIPQEWAKIWGIDFGINHPFAGVLVAWDRDEDVLYVCGEYAASDATPIVHCHAIRQIASEPPVAWPHDGHSRDRGSGEQLISHYKLNDRQPYGLRCLPEHSTFPQGGFSTEAAVLEVQQRLQKAGGPGGLRIREDCVGLLEELRMYHRKDGVLVKQHDDRISALFKAVMMKRKGAPVLLGQGSMGRKRLRPTRRPDINPWTGRPVLEVR